MGADSVPSIAAQEGKVNQSWESGQCDSDFSPLRGFAVFECDFSCFPADVIDVDCGDTGHSLELEFDDAVGDHDTSI